VGSHANKSPPAGLTGGQATRQGIRELVSKLLANALSEIAICLIRLNDLMRVTGYVDRIDQIIGRPCAGGSSHRKTLIKERGAGFAYKTGVPFLA
jgi:hypothetical protein